MSKALWKVGELAKETGLSVRTLRYYDQIALLSPSRHTGAGHRLYGAGDVSRLYRIVALRNLGLSLDEVKSCLGKSNYSPKRSSGFRSTAFGNGWSWSNGCAVVWRP